MFGASCRCILHQHIILLSIVHIHVLCIFAYEHHICKCLCVCDMRATLVDKEAITVPAGDVATYHFYANFHGVDPILEPWCVQGPGAKENSGEGRAQHHGWQGISWALMGITTKE